MYRVDEAACTGCGDCVEACPTGAMLVDGRAHIDEATCVDCGSCVDACPRGAIVMATAASPVYAAIKPGTSVPVVVPAAASVEAASLARRPEVEVLPAMARRNWLWPTVGSALLWAARELLPEVVAAWRASRAEVSQPISFNPDASDRCSPASRRNGYRHRWGRV